MDNVLTPNKLAHLAGRCAGAAVRHANDLFGVILFRQAARADWRYGGYGFSDPLRAHLPFGVAFFLINLPFTGSLFAGWACSSR
jgi:hypothetical protein